jgi:hypothetical protein
VPKGPRGEKPPGDANGAAIMVAKIATGEDSPKTKDPAAKALGAKAKKYTVNPNTVAQKYDLSSGEQVIRLLALQRGRPLAVREVRSTADQLAFSVLSRFLETGEAVARTREEASLMEDLGLIIDAANVSRRPRFIAPYRQDRQNAALTTDCAESREGIVPEMSSADWERFRKRAKAPERLVWTQKVPWAVINPWRSRDDARRPSGDLEVPLSASELDAARSDFASGGLTTFRSGLPREQLVALRRYFRAIVNEGLVPLGDRQSQRYYMHNEPIARNLLARFWPLAQAVVDREIKPSYCYFASYIKSSELPRHTDFAQCQYSAAMLIDCDPLRSGRSIWPLRFHLSEGRDLQVMQAPGDVTLYRGPLLPHSRPAFAGRSSTSVFLHYVDTEFDGPLD